MRIEIDIPDWVIEEKRGIFIFGGMELVAYKYHGENIWKVKVARCSKCGKCCKRVKCEFLEKEPGNNPKWICNKGSSRPFSCSAGVLQGRDGCTEEYATVL
jgi:hypothetical protein